MRFNSDHLCRFPFEGGEEFQQKGVGKGDCDSQVYRPPSLHASLRRVR